MAKIRIRVPELWHGDFLALLGAARIGERKLLEFLREEDRAKLAAYPTEWFDYSERLMIGAIQRLPDGETTTSGWHDPIPGILPDGIEIRSSIKVDSRNACIDVDLRDNVDCQPCGLNLTEATAKTAAMMGVFTGLGSVVPPNEGSFRRLNVKLRENCIVGIPRHPYSCSVATTNLSELVANCVVRGIASLGDGYGMAATGKASPASTAVISGKDPRSGGEPFVNQLMLGFTGGAASPTTDGWLTIIGLGAAGFLMRDSVEILEMKYPIIVYQQSIIPDSEGAGRFCGAPGARVEFGPHECELEAVWLSEGTTHPPIGVRGGENGSLAQQYIRRVEGSLSNPMGTYERVTIKAGERVVSICTGGAGYGPAPERDPLLVERDVLRGWISRERAQVVYKVEFGPDGVVDMAATTDARTTLNPIVA